MTTTPVIASYTIEQAEEDISTLRGQVDLFDELLTQNDFVGDSPPNAPAAGGYSMYSASSQQKYVAELDGNFYNNGTQRYIVPTNATAQVINTTGLTTITGLRTPSPLAIGTWHIYGEVVYVGNQSAGTPTFSYGGGTLGGSNTKQRGDFYVLNSGATSPLCNFTRALSYATDQGPTLVSSGFVSYKYDLVITTTTAATFGVRAQTSVGADTFTIQLGSWMYIEGIV